MFGADNVSLGREPGGPLSAGRSAAIPATRSPRWWPGHPTRCGPGTSPRLLGPEKWQYSYLYVILDIYSRYATGWMVAERETAALAGHLIGETCLKHGVQPRALTLHSDRGSPWCPRSDRAKSVTI